MYNVTVKVQQSFFLAGFLLTLMVVIYLTSVFVLSAPSSGDDGGGDLLVSALFNFNTSTSPPQRNRGNHIRTCTHTESDTADVFIYFYKMCTSTSMWVGPSNVVSHDTPHTSKCASFFLIACSLVMCGFHCAYVVSREETCWPDLLYYNLYNVCIVCVSFSVVSVCIFGAFCLCV